MRFGVSVEGARWDEDEQHWVVSTSEGTHTTRFLMTATGFLSQPRLPDIEGVHDFAGEVVHTAKWDDSAALEGKAGRGHRHRRDSGALIPQIAKVASELTVFQRTPIWVTPKTDFRIPKVLQRLFAVTAGDPSGSRVGPTARGSRG